MWRFWKQCAAFLAVAATVGLYFSPFSAAKGPGGSGSTAAYSIVDLPGPDHQANGGWSQTYAERISDVSANGGVYILGRFEIGGGIALPCRWARDAQGAVAVVDLSDLFDSARDINSAGVVCGIDAGRPALVMPDLTVAYLSAPGIIGEARALNNPNGQGVFHVVGLVAAPPSPYEFVMWEVASNGAVLATTSLVNTQQGITLNPWDINDQKAIAGFARIQGQYFPALGAFNEGLQCTVLEDPNPNEIKGFRGFRLDASRNVVGEGYQPSPTGADYSRAVIWPAAGAAIDLGAVTNITATDGNGIAVVKGAMQVVGRAESDGRGSFAYLYSNQKMNNLGPMSKGDSPWSFDRAEDVNAAGMICGVGVVGSRSNRQWHGFLLMPTGN